MVGSARTIQAVRNVQVANRFDNLFIKYFPETPDGHTCALHSCELCALTISAHFQGLGAGYAMRQFGTGARGEHCVSEGPGWSSAMD